jgi:hypothetical protein
MHGFYPLKFVSRKLRLPLTLVVAVLALGWSQASAQSTGTTFLVVEVNGLTPQSYADIHFAFADDTSVLIERSCVPAGVILFRRLATNATFESVRNRIISAGVPANAVKPTELNAAGFDQRCANARIGRTQ